MNSTIAICALLGAAFSLFASLSVETRPGYLWSLGAYWVCAVIATGAMYGVNLLVLVAGWMVATSVFIVVQRVVALLVKGYGVTPQHHNHSSH